MPPGELLVLGMTNIDTIWKAETDVVLNGASNIGSGTVETVVKRPFWGKKFLIFGNVISNGRL